MCRCLATAWILARWVGGDAAAFGLPQSRRRPRPPSPVSRVHGGEPIGGWETTRRSIGVGDELHACEPTGRGHEKEYVLGRIYVLQPRFAEQDPWRSVVLRISSVGFYPLEAVRGGACRASIDDEIDGRAAARTAPADSCELDLPA